MPGGLLQIIAYGYQDKILVEPPEITFFKTIYKKPTLFSIDSYYNPIDVTEFDATKQIVVPNYGDLLKNATFKIQLPSVQFQYQTPIDSKISSILHSNIYNREIDIVYFNVDKLKAFNTTNTTNTCVLLKSNTNAIDLLFDEITLQNALEYPTYDSTIEKSTTVTAINYENKSSIIYENNNVFTNIITTKNSNILLTATEQEQNSSMLAILRNIQNYTGTNVQNFITNLSDDKLEVTDIIQSNYDLYLYYINLSKYLNGTIIEAPLNTFDSTMIELHSTLQHTIMQSHEIHSYDQIINHTSPKNHFMYLLTTKHVKYEYSVIIIIDATSSVYATMKIKKILNVVNITINGGRMAIQAHDIMNQYDASLMTISQFITCSNKVDDVLSYTDYFPIQSVIPYDITNSVTLPVYDILGSIVMNGYSFQIAGNLTQRFTTNKIAFIFTSKPSYPYAAFKIVSSSYDAVHLLTTIIVEKINNTYITNNDNIYVKDNCVLPIFTLADEIINTDVVNDYNGYLKSISRANLDPKIIHQNLKSILPGAIKYNNTYLKASYSNIFNSLNFLFDLLQIFVLPGTTPSFSRPTLINQNINIPIVVNDITNLIISQFTAKVTSDIGYNFYNEYIKTVMTKFISTYDELMLKYHDTFYNLGDTLINQYFQIIANLTIPYTLPTTNVLSNIVINTDGPSYEYMMILTTSVLPAGPNTSFMTTNKFSFAKYEYNVANSLINFNRLHIGDDIVLINPTVFRTNHRFKYIVDNSSQVYVVNKDHIMTTFRRQNEYNAITFSESAVPWSSAVQSIGTNFQVIQSISFNANGKFIIERNTSSTNYYIYYISKLYDVIQLQLQLNPTLSFIPTSMFYIDNKQYVSAMYYYQNGIDVLTYRDRIITNVNCVNSIITKNISTIRRNIDQTKITDYFHFPYVMPLPDTNQYIYTFMVDIDDKLLYVIRNGTLPATSPTELTNIIHLTSFVYDGTDHVFRSDFHENFDILNFTITQNSVGVFNIYMYIHDLTFDVYYYDQYLLTMLQNDVFYSLTFVIRLNVLGENNNLPNKVYYFGGYYYEFYKQVIIKKQPDLGNNLTIILEQRTLYDVINKIKYNNNYIALYYRNSNTIEISFVNTLTSAVPNPNRLIITLPTGIIVRNIVFDMTNGIIDTINGVSYTSINYATYMYIFDEANNIHFKLVSVVIPTLPAIPYVNSIDDILLIYDVNVYGKMYSLYRKYLSPVPVDTQIHIITSNNILQYDIITKITSVYKADNSFTYMYDNDTIYVSDYLHKIVIHDVKNSRMLTCNYVDNGGILTISNVTSFNYISSDNLTVVVNNVTDCNYTNNTALSILFIETTYINLFSVSDNVNNTCINYYTLLGSRNIAELLNNLSIIYDNNGRLIILSYTGTTLNINYISTNLSNLLTVSTTLTLIISISVISYISTSVYQLYYDGTNDYLLVTDTTSPSYNANLYQIDNQVQLINNTIPTSFPNTIPYVTNNVCFDDINELKPLNNNDYLLICNTSLFYVYDKLIYKTNYSNVISIDTYANIVYVYTTSPDILYVINTDQNTIVTWNIPSVSYPPIINLYTLSQLGINDCIATTTTNYVVIYQYTGSNLVPINTLNIVTSTIKSATFSIQPIDLTKVMYVLTHDYNITAYNINAYNSGPITLMYIYATPYLITSPINSTTYVPTPEINYPYLHYVEFLNNRFNEYIVGQENIYITFLLDDAAGTDFPTTFPDKTLHRIKYMFLKETNINIPYIKDVRDNINDYTTLSDPTDPTKFLTIAHYYENTTIPPPVTSTNITLTDNNSYVTTDFNYIQSSIIVHTIDERTYSEKKFKNTFTIYENEITNIMLTGNTATAFVITIQYTVLAKAFNTYTSTNPVIITDKNDIIPFDTVVSITNGYNLYNNIQIVSAATVISTKGYFSVSLTYQTYAITDVLTVHYNIPSLFISNGVSGYIFVEINNVYYPAKVTNIDITTDDLTIYYKLYDKITWYNGVIAFDSSIYIEYIKNSINFYQGQTIPTIDYTTVNYFSANVLLLDYMSYLSTNMQELEYRLTPTSDNYNVNNDLYKIINNEFMRQIIILTNGETNIINSDTTNHCYDIGFGTGFTNPYPLYLKLSHNFNNMIGYVAINTTIRDKIVDLYLKNYKNAIYRLRSKSYDYIVDKLCIVANDEIAYLYDYLKQLIILSNQTDEVFISKHNKSSYYLLDNIINFQNMYNAIINQYKLVPWIVIENAIYELNHGMNRISKLLHTKIITDPNNSYQSIYLINSYYVQPINIYNTVTYYLNKLDDMVIIDYLLLLINGVYSTYTYKSVLDVHQSVIDLYYNTLNKLFDGSIIGSETYKQMNDIAFNYDANMNTIYIKRNTVPQYKYDPFVIPSSYGLLQLNNIVTYLADINTDIIVKYDYYVSNNAILNIVNDKAGIYTAYESYVKNKPFARIVSFTSNTIVLDRIQNITVGYYVGFYVTSYNIYKVTAINYITNEITLDNITALSSIVPFTPILIGMDTLKLRDLRTTVNIISNTANTITVDNLSISYLEIGQYVSFNSGILQCQDFRITAINFTTNTITLDLSNMYNTSYPSSATLVSNISKTVTIGITMQNRHRIYHEPDIRYAICSIIFNTFNDIDNVNYTGSSFWNYFTGTGSLRYFRPYYTITYPTDIQIATYETFIQSNMNSKYNTTDVTLLAYVFEKVFSVQNIEHTTDNILSSFSEIININKINDNAYYDALYTTYLLNTSLVIDNVNFVDESNIENAMTIANFSTDDSKFALLKLVNQTSKRHEFIYDIFKIGYVPIYLPMSSINYGQYELLLSTNIFYEFTYPYVNTASFNSVEFNSARILQNGNCTKSRKIGDIIQQLENLITYYGSDLNAVKQHMIEIYSIDEATKNIAIAYLNSKLTLQPHVKFNLYNSSSYTELVTFESIVYTYPSDINFAQLDRVVYDRNVLIDKGERAGYFRLKYQQLLLWNMLVNINPSIDIKDLYYRYLPNTPTYNHNVDNIDVLSDIQRNNIKYCLDLFINYYEKIVLTPTTIPVDILALQTMIDFFDGTTISTWDTYINQFDDANMTFDYCSNLVLPCHIYYIAYTLNKACTEPTTTTQFVYSTSEYKKDLNNYTIQQYTANQVIFLIQQQNKTIFNIGDWYGNIDGVPKVYLCNRYLMVSEMKPYMPSNNSDTTYTSVYLLLLSRSNVNMGLDNLTIFNYLLMVLLNGNMNYIESSLIYNSNTQITNKYPTLYLTNGRLIRTTNLLDDMYYTITTISSISVLQINKIKMDVIGNSSIKTIYNVFQNTISKTITHISTLIFSIYSTMDVIANGINDIDINLTGRLYIGYTFTITAIAGNVISFNLLGSALTDIDINTYFYITIGGSSYYYFIDAISYGTISNGGVTTITINVNLSDNLSNLSIGTVINGGVTNLINNIYNTHETRYIRASLIIDRHDDFINNSNNLIQYVFKTDVMSNNGFIYKLIKELIANQQLISAQHNIIPSNYINNVTLKNVKKQLYKNITYLQMINENTNININPLLDITKYPLNEYYPKEPVGRWIDYIGHYIFDYIDIYIGGELVQRITDDYLHIYYQTNVEYAKRRQYLYNIGYNEKFMMVQHRIEGGTIYVMVPWFFSSPGCNLPMIALINTKVSIKVKTKNIDRMFKVGYNVKPIIHNMTTDVIFDYIFLEEEERLKFATNRHEYLIEQLQYDTHHFKRHDIINDNVKFKLGMNQSVKDIYWFCNVESNIIDNNLSNYTYGRSNYNKVLFNFQFFKCYKKLIPLVTAVYIRHRNIIPSLTIDQVNISWFTQSELYELIALIKDIPEFDELYPILNSELLLMARHILHGDTTYTNYVIPYTNYENTFQPGLNAYSFALEPNDTTKPSGSLNMSVMNDVTLKLRINNDVVINNNYINVKVVGRNYNILRIFSGFGACIY